MARARAPLRGPHEPSACKDCTPGPPAAPPRLQSTPRRADKPGMKPIDPSQPSPAPAGFAPSLQRVTLLRLGVAACGLAVFLGVAALLTPRTGGAATGRTVLEASAAGGRDAAGSGVKTAQARSRLAAGGVGASSPGVILAAAGVDRPEQPKSLGTLAGREYSLEVFATAQGPRYTIRDAAGRTLAALLPDHEIYQAVPQLPIEQFHAAVTLAAAGDLGAPLMHVDGE